MTSSRLLRGALLAALCVSACGCDSMIDAVVRFVALCVALAFGLVGILGATWALATAAQRKRAALPFVLSIPFALLSVAIVVWMFEVSSVMARDEVPFVIAIAMPCLWFVAGLVAVLLAPPRIGGLPEATGGYRSPGLPSPVAVPPLSRRRLEVVVGGASLAVLAGSVGLGLAIAARVQPASGAPAPLPSASARETQAEGALAPLSTGPLLALPLSAKAPARGPAPEILAAPHLGGVGRKGSLHRVEFDVAPDEPVRGSILADGPHRFVAHEARSAAPLGRDWIVVESTTGVWLHEAASLVKRARLAPPPVTGLAAAPDGKAFAYGVGSEGSSVELRVVSFPDLEVTRALRVDVPRRIRFTPSGRRLVVASAREETVTLIDLEDEGPAAITRYDTGDDVNDAVGIPDRPDVVAYASETDDAFLYDMKAKRRLFTSELISRARRGYVPRDFNAVAFDEATGELIAGGDDNVVWRYSDFGTRPTGLPSVDLDGNVEEIACTGRGRAVAALDETELVVVDAKGEVVATLGPFGLGVFGEASRVHALPSGAVVAALEGRLVRWDPSTPEVALAADYARKERWSASELERDTALFACDQGGVGLLRCSVHRVAHGAAAADVAAERIGAATFESSPRWLDFAEGDRALLGLGREGRLRLAFLHGGGPLDEATDTPAIDGGLLSDRPDRRAYGYLEPSGKLFEIAAKPPGITLAGRVAGPGRAHALAWDERARRWSVKTEGGGDLAVVLER